MRRILAGVTIAALVSGCATMAAKPFPRFRVTETVAGVEVRAYLTRRDLLAGVPAHVAAFSASIEKVDPGRGIGAFYDQAAKVIHVQGGDTMALVHEFKHHVDAPWVHGFTSSPEDQGWRQVGPDKIFNLHGREFAVRDGEVFDSVIARLKEFFR